MAADSGVVRSGYSAGKSQLDLPDVTSESFDSKAQKRKQSIDDSSGPTRKVSMDREEDCGRIVRPSPAKTAGDRPVTIGVAPSMCQPPPKPGTPPLWASILGIPAVLDTGRRSGAEKSSVSVRHISRNSSFFSAEEAPLVVLPSPVEEQQRVEWRLKHLERDMKLQRVSYKGLLIHPGKHIISQCISLAGVQGFLRFWPNGYFNWTQSKRFKSSHDLGGMRADSWCAVGLFMPPGTHFKVRFFIGEERSEAREVYWSPGEIRQIWMPDAKEPPKSLEDLVVGVEVFKNCRHLRPNEAKPPSLRTSPRQALEKQRMGYMDASPRQLVLPVANSPRKSPRLDLSHLTELALALPSPRFSSLRR